MTSDEAEYERLASRLASLEKQCVQIREQMHRLVFGLPSTHLAKQHPPRLRRRGRPGRPRGVLREIILEQMPKTGPVFLIELRERVRARMGVMTESAFNNAIAALVTEGSLVRVNRGRYTIPAPHTPPVPADLAV